MHKKEKRKKRVYMKAIDLNFGYIQNLFEGRQAQQGYHSSSIGSKS